MDYFDAKIAEHEREVYGVGNMGAHQKSTLRSMLKAEELFYLKQDAREDSNSVVGDRFNQRTY